MDWVSGIGRNDDGDLCVQVQVFTPVRSCAPGSQSEPSGSATKTAITTVLKALGKLDTKLGGAVASDAVHRKVYLALHELRVGETTTRGYLDGLGLTSLDAGGQPVYEVSTSVGLLAIPAQILVQAVLGNHHQLRQALLRPWGPTFLMSAATEPGAPSVMLRPTPHRMLRIHLEKPAIATKLEWVLAYPSASAAWGSVYRHALDGRFDMEMPKAFATASVIGRQIGDKLLVTRMEIAVITPAEEPQQFATETAKRSLVLIHRNASAPTHDERFPCVHRQQSDGTSTATVQPLTEVQWARIEPMVKRALNPAGLTRAFKPRTHARRDVIDVIRLKLGAPYSWGAVPADKKLVSTASMMLTKLKRANVWEAIVAASREY